MSAIGTASDGKQVLSPVEFRDNESIKFYRLLNVLLCDSKVSEFPKGAKERKLAKDEFNALLKALEKRLEVNLGVRTSRRASLAFWKHYKAVFPNTTAKEIKGAQQKVATYLLRKKRKTNQINGVSSRGRLLKDHLWRQLKLGDFEENSWGKKLSFVPVVKLGSFGAENLSRLRQVNQRLVQAIRLRGGGTETGTHKKGASLGLTVESGGVIVNKLASIYPGEHISGSLQLGKKIRPCDHVLREEVIRVVTACIEEAFGNQVWYRAI